MADDLDRQYRDAIDFDEMIEERKRGIRLPLGQRVPALDSPDQPKESKPEANLVSHSSECDPCDRGVAVKGINHLPLPGFRLQPTKAARCYQAQCAANCLPKFRLTGHTLTLLTRGIGIGNTLYTNDKFEIDLAQLREYGATI